MRTVGDRERQREEGLVSAASAFDPRTAEPVSLLIWNSLRLIRMFSLLSPQINIIHITLETVLKFLISFYRINTST